MPPFTESLFVLSVLTEGLDVSIQGDARCTVKGVCTIQASKPGHITFLTNASYRKYLSGTTAAAVILSPQDAADCPVTAVISKNPLLTYAKIATYFNKQSEISAGVHPTAQISPLAEVHPSASIGAGTFIAAGVKIGALTQIDANVSIYHDVIIGERVRIASGAVIGKDGFGFANDRGKWVPIPQLGTVEIGDEVHIGANTTIDRGAIENTVIESGVILDNQIQIAHNVRIGQGTAIAAQAGIAGSTVIGKHCMIGGASCIAGHITICDGVILTGLSTVTKSIMQPGFYSSGIVGAVPNKEFLKQNARFYRLKYLMKRVENLEKNSFTEKANERDEIYE